MNDLLILAKNCLSIVNTSTAKDLELKMLIEAAIADLKRQGINISINTGDSLVKSAIVMYVKANFGSTDIKEKELAQKTYSLLCNNLGLSSEYKESDSNA